MAVVEVHPVPIDGPWIEGFVLDRHVISSVPIGYLGEHMQFDTTRSALGELVYQLKYRNGPLNDIVETAVAFIKRSMEWRHRLRRSAAAVAAPNEAARGADRCGDSRGSRGAIPCCGSGQGHGDAANEERRSSG